MRNLASAARTCAHKSEHIPRNSPNSSGARRGNVQEGNRGGELGSHFPLYALNVGHRIGWVIVRSQEALGEPGSNPHKFMSCTRVTLSRSSHISAERIHLKQEAELSDMLVARATDASPMYLSPSMQACTYHPVQRLAPGGSSASGLLLPRSPRATPTPQRACGHSSCGPSDVP
eukprot:286499-Amphidinium_carterae.1